MKTNIGLHGDYGNEHWALVDGDGNALTEYKYNYVTAWGEGYFKAEIGAKKNILRPDGSEVLTVWFNDVFKVENGFFIIGNTIRKTATKPTQYLQGIAHVSGTILFPPIFKHVHWNGEDKRFFYAEYEDKPLLLSTDGSIYDPQKSHLPKNILPNMTDYFEKFASWVLPGLQFFYRDTDAPVDVDLVYHVGDVIRAGIFMDVTTKLLKPAHKLRYIIGSAHAAMLCQIESLCRENPDVEKWNLCSFHPNSFFKILDIYRVGDITQVFLLHIPESAAHFFGDNQMLFNFIDQVSGSKNNLVAMARASLDEKMKMDVHPRSLDSVFVDRMHLPVGLDQDGLPTPLPPVEMDDNDDAAPVYNMIRKLSHDEDIEITFEVHDNFPWNGVKGSICDGCIYAQGIKGEGEGCGRLFKNSFRDRYIKNDCEYRKRDLFTPSVFEEKRTREQQAAKLKAEKTGNTFALNLVKDFINEQLNGDIDKLKDFQMFSLQDNPKYGNPYNCNDNKLLRSILTLVFEDIWPGLSVDGIETGNFECHRINDCYHLLGANIMDEYFILLQKMTPRPGQHATALSATRKCETIGNFIVWPSKASFGQVLDGYDTRKLMDQFLMRLYDVLTEQKKVNLDLKAAVYKNRTYMDAYKGTDGFKKFVRDMMLENYVDPDLMPSQIFDFVWGTKKGLSRDEYLNAVDNNCKLWTKLVSERTERIIDKLKQVLNEQA